MGILYGLLIFIYVLVCFLLVVVILLQSSRGGGLAATFGGQATTIFGPRTAASALSKLTQYLASGFLVLSFVLSLIAGASTRRESGTQRVLERSPVGALPSVEELNLSGGAETRQERATGEATSSGEPYKPGE